MAFLGWFDGELRPDAWFDAELQPAGWFDTELINTAGGSTVAAVCVNNDGSMTYKPAATGSDKKLYLNAGFLFARLSAVGGDRIVTLNAGGFIAT
jgi:hypothetical protein